MNRTRDPTDAGSASLVAICEKPKRCLTAYNIFFQQVRQKLLEALPSRVGSDDDDTSHGLQAVLHKTSGKSASNLSKKRASSHKKIGFATLARVVAAQWKNTPAENREVFETLAAQDRERYDKEMDEWRRRRLEHTRRVGLPSQNQSESSRYHHEIREHRLSTGPPLVPSHSTSPYSNAFRQKEFFPTAVATRTRDEHGESLSSEELLNTFFPSAISDFRHLQNLPGDAALAKRTQQKHGDIAVNDSVAIRPTLTTSAFLGDRQAPRSSFISAVATNLFDDHTNALSNVPFPTPIPTPSFQRKQPLSSEAAHEASLRNLVSQLDEETMKFMILKFLP